MCTIFRQVVDQIKCCWVNLCCSFLYCGRQFPISSAQHPVSTAQGMQHQDQTLQLKISEEDVKGEDRGTYVTNAGGCTLVTKGFFLHVTINESSSSRTDSSSSGSTAKQEKHTAFFKVERHIIDGSLYRSQETIAFPLYGHLMDIQISSELLCYYSQPYFRGQ